MSENQQPREYDAVLGGNSPILEGAAVLGGIEWVKFRLNNSEPQVRIAALKQAVNYGEQWLDLVIQALQDESLEVQMQAYALLISLTELKVKNSLLNFNPRGLKLEPIAVVTVNRSGQIIRREQRLGRYFTEDLGDGVTLDMAAIPGGNFIMGSPEGEEGSQSWERPQHQVTIQPFYMGKYPITQAQWQRVAKLPQVNQKLEPNPSSYKGGNRPVESVSWHDAVEFCARLASLTKRDYSLPSEAQWEYACRAGTKTPFHFGETLTTDLANYNCNHSYGDGPKGVCRGETTEVGSFGLANAFGLYDMHGNVWEWCLDDWHSNYEGAPTDGSAWLDGNNNLSQKKGSVMQRGGCWRHIPVSSRSAYRSSDIRAVRSDSYHTAFGFRVACGVGRILQ
jgi:formylglycine-generating enzyme required for sulfatase activity